MIGLFILGLITGAVISILVIVLLNMEWFYNFSKNKINEAPDKKVLIININNVYNDVQKLKTVEDSETEYEYSLENTGVISESKKDMLLSDLEKMCSETPYVVAEYDDTSKEVANYEAIKADTTDEDFIQNMKENDGLILVGA